MYKLDNTVYVDMQNSISLGDTVMLCPYILDMPPYSVYTSILKDRILPLYLKPADAPLDADPIELNLNDWVIIFYSEHLSEFFIVQPIEHVTTICKENGITIWPKEPKALYGNIIDVDDKTKTFLKLSGKIT